MCSHGFRSMHQLIAFYAFVRSGMRQERCFLHELFFVWRYCFAIKLFRSNLSFFRPCWARCIILPVFHFHRCRRVCSMFYLMLYLHGTQHIKPDTTAKILVSTKFIKIVKSKRINVWRSFSNACDGIVYNGILEL